MQIIIPRLDSLESNMELFRKSFTIVEVLSTAIHVIDTYGWISREVATDKNVLSSSDITIDLLMSDTGVSISSDQHIEVQNALEWIHSMGPGWIRDSGYNRNLHSACSSHTIHISYIALITSLIPTYRRWNEMLALYEESQKNGSYIGIPLLKGFWRESFDTFDDAYGEDNSVELTILVTDVVGYNGNYGKINKITFVDDKGRFGHFSINIRRGQELYIKDCWYVISGIVREHRIDSLHMRPETVLRKVHQIEKLP